MYLHSIVAPIFVVSLASGYAYTYVVRSRQLSWRDRDGMGILVVNLHITRKSPSFFKTIFALVTLSQSCTLAVAAAASMLDC